MMYSSKSFFANMAALCAPRFLALAILVFLGAGSAFSQSSPVYITGWDSDAEAIVNVNNAFFDVRPFGNSIFGVRVDLGNGATASDASDLGDYLSDMNNSLHRLPTIVERLNTVLSTMTSHGYNLAHIEQYTQSSSENSTNLPAIKNALYYNDGLGNTESVADILADIRDNGFSSGGGFDLGVAFTNLVSALAFYSSAGYTNYNAFVEALNGEDGSFARQYGLEPLFYNMIYDGLPYYPSTWDSHQLVVPDSWVRSNPGQSQQQLLFNLARSRDSARGRAVSNVLQHAAVKKFDGYGTYQSRLMLSNLFYNANMLTWTNMHAAGISPNNFAMQWFDSYNTKFQNMLLEYGTLASITNENKQQVEFARNWYDSYSPRIVLEYLLNSDFLNGTNTLSGTLEALDDKIDSYSLSKLPTFGISTNSESIDMGVIQQNPDSGYAEEGDEIRQEKMSSASYLNNGWTIFDTIQENYDTVIDVIISKVHESSDGGGDGDGSISHSGLSLRIAALDTDYVDIPEQYIDFTLPSDAKDKITNFWALIKKCLEWGMWTWAFFACWGMLCDRDFKQSSPTILD